MTHETLTAEESLAAKVDDADVFTEEETDSVARIAVALNMSTASFDKSDLHRQFIGLLTKTKALRAHVDDADVRAARYREALLEAKEEIEYAHENMISPEERAHPRGSGWARVHDKITAALAGSAAPGEGT